jgi:putative transposase
VPTGRRKPAIEADGGRASAGYPSAEGDHRKKTGRPKAKRTAATLLVVRFGLSQRRVCRLVALDRNTLRYQSRRADNQGLRARMREIAETKRRYGCPRIYVRLRREGWRVNHKKVERLYREEALLLRRRERKKTTSVPRVALPMPTRPGLWNAMDFVHDRLANGRRFKCLTMTDPYSKEVSVIEMMAQLAGSGSVEFSIESLPDGPCRRS